MFLFLMYYIVKFLVFLDHVKDKKKQHMNRTQ